MPGSAAVRPRDRLARPVPRVVRGWGRAVGERVRAGVRRDMGVGPDGFGQRRRARAGDPGDASRRRSRGVHGSRPQDEGREECAMGLEDEEDLQNLKKHMDVRFLGAGGAGGKVHFRVRYTLSRIGYWVVLGRSGGRIGRWTWGFSGCTRGYARECCNVYRLSHISLFFFSRTVRPPLW